MFPAARCLCSLFLAVTVLCHAGSRSSFAGEEASPWHQAGHSRIRLISANDIPYQGHFQAFAAIEISLDPGWITYWRSPGDGLPPSLDWKQSRNLKEINVLWPAPMRLVEPGGVTTAGYEGRTVWPVSITPEDAKSPVKLALRISYGACREICVPEEASLRLEVPLSGNASHRDLIRAALDRVPKVQDRGVYCPHSFVAARIRTVNGKPALVIKTAFDERATGLDLFVEAPEGVGLPFPVSQPHSSRGRSHYIIDLGTDDAAKALVGKMLTLTLVSDQGSCETTWRVK